MTPERLQEIRDHTERDIEDPPADDELWLGWLTAHLHGIELLQHIDALHTENQALRRGQGTAPAPAGPGTTPFHTTHPIPDSTGGTR